MVAPGSPVTVVDCWMLFFSVVCGADLGSCHPDAQLQHHLVCWRRPHCRLCVCSAALKGPPRSKARRAAPRQQTPHPYHLMVSIIKISGRLSLSALNQCMHADGYRVLPCAFVLPLYLETQNDEQLQSTHARIHQEQRMSTQSLSSLSKYLGWPSFAITQSSNSSIT
jgi:hypothetical protein